VLRGVSWSLSGGGYAAANGTVRLWQVRLVAITPTCARAWSLTAAVGGAGVLVAAGIGLIGSDLDQPGGRVSADAQPGDRDVA
jgi:hypothetical protein